MCVCFMVGSLVKLCPLLYTLLQHTTLQSLEFDRMLVGAFPSTVGLRKLKIQT